MAPSRSVAGVGAEIQERSAGDRQELAAIAAWREVEAKHAALGALHLAPQPHALRRVQRGAARSHDELADATRIRTASRIEPREALINVIVAREDQLDAGV